MKILKNSAVGIIAVIAILVLLQKDNTVKQGQVWTKKGSEWSYVGSKSNEKKQIHIISQSSINSKEIFNTVIKMPFVTLEGKNRTHGKNWRKN